MNKQSRRDLRLAISLLEKAGEISIMCRDKEMDSLSNLEGTSLEYTERYEKMEEASDYLDRASDSIDEAIEFLSNAI